MTELDFEQARFNMIEQQIRPWEVLDPKVLEVLTSTPRELFTPQAHRHLAFVDFETPLGHDQFMMAPKVEGRLLQALDVQVTDRVLEIGTGSGFLTACLAQLGTHVCSVDFFAEFCQRAGENLRAAGIDNVTLEIGDACQGWNRDQQYDVIAITGSLSEHQDQFRQSLSDGGRLFVVTGDAPVMRARLITRIRGNEFATTTLFETDLKPLINAGKTPRFTL